AEDGIRDATVTGVQTCALPISLVTLPGKTRGSVEQDSVRRQPAHAAARRSEIFDPVVAGPGFSVSGERTIDDRVGAPDIGAAERSEERRVGRGQDGEVATVGIW